MRLATFGRVMEAGRQGPSPWPLYRHWRVVSYESRAPTQREREAASERGGFVGIDHFAFPFFAAAFLRLDAGRLATCPAQRAAAKPFPISLLFLADVLSQRFCTMAWATGSFSIGIDFHYKRTYAWLI